MEEGAMMKRPRENVGRIQPLAKDCRRFPSAFAGNAISATATLVRGRSLQDRFASTMARRIAVCLVVVSAASAWPRGAAAQGTTCNFPKPWANAVSWTGTFSMTANGSGIIPSPKPGGIAGSYSISQTVSGTVSLDSHEPLSAIFLGTATFTASAHEHYVVPKFGRYGYGRDRHQREWKL